MATYDYTLLTPPDDEQQRELWLQHAAGFIVFQDMREYAIEKIDSELSTEAQVAARKAIDDAVYGLMMILDGVSGSLVNEQNCVALRVNVELTERESERKIAVTDLEDSDGVCMAYHGWCEGDFGNHPIAELK